MISTKEDYNIIKSELDKVKNLSSGWGGRKQNNLDDDKINLFEIKTIEELNKKISNYDDASKEYYLKRWYIIKISDCDEYLFSTLPDTKINSDPYSKEYDLILKNIKFDIKGTRIPKSFSDNLQNVYINPLEIIRFYFNQQSTGRRFGIQNRLFIVTVDENNYENEIYLRKNFEIKEKAFSEFLNKLNPNRKFYEIKMGEKIVISDIIFIVKRNDKIITMIASDLIN